MSNPVASVNLSVYLGENYLHTFSVVSDLDLSGYTALMQVRKPEDDTLLYEATSESGKITVEAAAVTLDLPTSDTKAWTFQVGLYDLFVIAPDGDAYPVARGTVTVYDSVTQLP